MPQSIEAQKSIMGFLSLPAELRLQIYALVLTGFGYHILMVKARKPGKILPKSVRCSRPVRKRHGQISCSNRYCMDTKEPINLSLLRTCRTIYNEASLMPYSGNTFKFADENESYKMFTASRTSLQLQSIESLEILTDGPRFGEKKRNDIWHKMCITMESMANLKHLKLQLRMVHTQSYQRLRWFHPFTY